MGETNVTLPARSMRRKAFGANGASVVSVSRTSPRAGSPNPSSKPPPMAAVAERKLRREGDASSRVVISHPLVCRGLLDRRTDADIGAAAADVARHRSVDIDIARLGVASEQRACGHDLAGLAVPALRYVECKPSGLDFLAGRCVSNGFDRGNPLAGRRG